MQENDDNENEDDAVEGLALLEQQNPYQGAPIHREEQFRDSNLVNSETFEESSLWNPFQTCSDAYATLAATRMQRRLNLKVLSRIKSMVFNNYPEAVISAELSAGVM